MSMKDDIKAVLLGGVTMTAVEISKLLDADPASVSSLLKKMCDEGKLKRRASFGPRGGYGYSLNSKEGDGS